MYSPAVSDGVPVKEPESTAIIRKSVWQDMRNQRLSSCSDSEEDEDGEPSMSDLGNTIVGTRSGSRKSLQVQHLSTDSISSYDRRREKRGESNCFAIELHAMHDDLDARMVVDLLQASYDAYPDREYCALSVPTTQRHTPLLAHFMVSSFVRTGAQQSTNTLKHCVPIRSCSTSSATAPTTSSRAPRCTCCTATRCSAT